MRKSFLNYLVNVRQNQTNQDHSIFSQYFLLDVEAASQTSPSSAVCMFLRGSESLASAAPENLPTLH